MQLYWDKSDKSDRFNNDDRMIDEQVVRQQRSTNFFTFHSLCRLFWVVRQNKRQNKIQNIVSCRHMNVKSRLGQQQRKIHSSLPHTTRSRQRVLRISVWKSSVTFKSYKFSHYSNMTPLVCAFDDFHDNKNNKYYFNTENINFWLSRSL